MLYEYCREVAEAETRTITIFENNEFNLPAGHYSFIEMFCNEPGCDCRRCFFMVRADWSQETLATIGFGWESPDFYTRWMGDDELSDLLSGVGLEPMQPQSKHASEILRLFKMVLLPQDEYIKRVKRHYALMRSVVDGPKRQPRETKDYKRRKREKEKQRKLKQGSLQVTTTNSSGQKVVKPFDKSTYRHPTGKISVAFREYVNHVIDLGSTPPPPLEEANQALKLCQIVWNAAVVDTVEGTRHVKKMLDTAPDKNSRLMIEILTQLKQSEFGDDQRLIADYKCIPEGDSYRLQVTASHPSALGPLPENRILLKEIGKYPV